MIWDPRLSNHPFYGISCQEYDHDKKKLIGERQIIFKGTNAKLTEAPHLYKINNYYYLLTAEGGTRYEHRATIARSKNINGPYELSPHNPLITGFFTPEEVLQKAGHASIVQTHTDEWYLTYLTGRPLEDNTKPLLDNPRGYCPLGRETAISKIVWENDWPIIQNGNYPQLLVEPPNIPVQAVPKQEALTTFTIDQLPLDFQTLRLPSESFASLTEREGYLRLTGKESLTSLFTQAFVARRWQHFQFEAETKIDCNPTSFQQFAGLVNYYNTENWVACDITFNEENGRILTITSCDNCVFTAPLETAVILEPGDVFLKVTVENNYYYFSYRQEGKSFSQIGPKFDSYKLSDDYIQGGGFFTGAFVGMHCVDLVNQNLHADFEYFRYEPIE